MSFGETVKFIWHWMRNHFDDFNDIAGWASIVGLVVTIVTLLRVKSLSAALRERAVQHIHGGLFDRASVALAGKPNLTKRHKSDIASLLREVRLAYVSWVPFKSRQVVRQIRAIEMDLAEGVSPPMINDKLKKLRVLVEGDSPTR